MFLVWSWCYSIPLNNDNDNDNEYFILVYRISLIILISYNICILGPMGLLYTASLVWRNFSFCNKTSFVNFVSSMQENVFDIFSQCSGHDLKERF